MEEIADWLDRLGLGQYVQAFADNDIDLDVLAELTGEDLKEIGVGSVGHRRKMLGAIAALGGGHAQAATVAQSPPTSAERRNLTVMFCDLMDSTYLSVRSDPEEYRDFISDFRRILADVVHAFGGNIAQYLGDGAFVYFGYPKALEYGAESAVAAGLEIAARVSQLDLFAGQQPRVRIGVATGLAVVGPVTDKGMRLGESAVGETPNLAARLQAEAPANGVVIADSTREIIGALFHLEDFGTRQLKGFSEPVQTWKVLGQSVSESRFDALGRGRASAFVGREAELQALRARHAEARAGAGQVAVLVGESGIGKSRLARELVALEAPAQKHVPVFQCSPYNTTAPFYMFRHFFAREIGQATPGDIGTTAIRSYLAQSGLDTDENCALMGDFLGVADIDRTPLRGLRSIEQRARLMNLQIDLTRALARHASIMVFEDLQWVDPSSAELLGTLNEKLGDFPLMQVITVRPGFWPEWIARSNTLLLDLKALPIDVIADLVRNAAGDAALDPDLIAQIAERCGGTPIFAEELTRGYLTSNAADRQIPATLADALLHRLDRLTHGNSLAQIGSVIGNEFPVDLLCALVDLPEAAAREGVAELVDAQLFYRGKSAFGDTVGFRHALLREAAYDLLLTSDRKAQHARVVLTLRKDFADLAEEIPNVMAAQLEAAGQFADAAQEWNRAGSRAVGRSAYAESVSHYRKALDAMERAGGTAAQDGTAVAVRLSLVGSLIASTGFNSDAVVEELARAERAARTVDAGTNLLPTLAKKWAVIGSGGDVRGCTEVALQIKDIARDGSEIDRLLAYRILGTSMIFGGRFTAAEEELSRFFDLFDAGRHDAELAKIGPSNHPLMTMVGLSQIYTIFDQAETAAAWRARAMDYAASTGQAHDLCNAHVFCGCLLAGWHGDTEVLRENAETLEQLATDNNLPFWRPHATLFRGACLARSGQRDEGLAIARSGLDQLAASTALMNCWSMVYAELATELGELGEAEYALNLSAPVLRQGETWLAAEYNRVNALVLNGRGAEAGAVAGMLDEAERIAKEQGAALFLKRVEVDRARLSLS